MDKKTLIIILIAVLILAGTYYYQKYYKLGTVPDVSNIPFVGPTIQSVLPVQKKPPVSIPKPTSKPVSKTHVVNLNDSGTEPRSLDVSKGDTVRFVNNGTRPFWVASDPHPVHNLCPGFDTVHGLVHGESWSYTFNFDAPRTCSYHNHVDVTTVTYRGSINIVK